MTTQWYTDQSARDAHALAAKAIKPVVQQLLGPTYELSHIGINKNEENGEVVLKLHLNPIGKVRIASDPLQIRWDK